MSILKSFDPLKGRWTHGLRNWAGYTAAAIVRMKALAPYALIELILPGGSVMALLLWIYRRRKNGVVFGPQPMKIFAVLRIRGNRFGRIATAR